MQIVRVTGEQSMSVKIKEPIPSAPPLEQMDVVFGYEGTSYDAGKGNKCVRKEMMLICSSSITK